MNHCRFLGRCSALQHQEAMASLFAWAFSRLFLVSQQCFSLTTNQPIVFSAMAYQPSEQHANSTKRSCIDIIFLQWAELQWCQ